MMRAHTHIHTHDTTGQGWQGRAREGDGSDGSDSLTDGSDGSDQMGDESDVWRILAPSGGFLTPS